jgi:uncharacterized membrane protein YhdT
MRLSSKTIARLTNLIHAHNRDVALDVAIKAGLGVLFTLVTFTFVWWMSWYLAFRLAGLLGLEPWVWACIITAIIFISSVWTAWQRVDPFEEMSLANAHERLRVAGLSLILMAGPANLFDAIAACRHLIRADDSLIDEAADLLASCDPALDKRRVRDLAAAFLLKELALIKVRPGGEETVLMLTEKGAKVLGGKKAGRR